MSAEHIDMFVSTVPKGGRDGFYSDVRAITI